MELDDGTRMRRAKPKRTPRVEQAIVEYQALIRHLDAADLPAEAFAMHNAQLDARLMMMELGELKVYYEEIRRWRLSIRWDGTALPEPPVSWA